MLSFSYYLHEKAEESRHSESVAYCVAMIGSVFLTGGIIQTLITVQRPQWFLIFPYQIGASPYDFLGLGFTLIGVMLFLAGIILGVHYGAQRLWYTNALKEAYRFEEDKLKARTKSRSEVLELPVQRATENPELQEPEALETVSETAS
jgi:predicted permease